jgi:hypothetical protein
MDAPIKADDVTPRRIRVPRQHGDGGQAKLGPVDGETNVFGTELQA